MKLSETTNLLNLLSEKTMSNIYNRDLLRKNIRTFVQKILEQEIDEKSLNYIVEDTDPYQVSVALTEYIESQLYCSECMMDLITDLIGTCLDGKIYK